MPRLSNHLSKGKSENVTGHHTPNSCHSPILCVSSSLKLVLKEVHWDLGEIEKDPGCATLD